MTVELLSADDGAALVTIGGELDMKTISELEAAVEPILSGNPARLVVDVSGVSFADSSAIALWVRWANRIRQVEIYEPSVLIRRVITRMGLAERLRMTHEGDPNLRARPRVRRCRYAIRERTVAESPAA